MASRANVYVDGFNLYYGALMRTPVKWLNLERYFNLLRTDDTIQHIHYFTAEITGNRRANQQTYLRALRTLSRVTITLGEFKRQKFKCKVPGCTNPGKRRYRDYVEKQTDVALAVRMVEDAFDDRCDTFVLVTNDTDVTPAIRMIRNRFPKKRIVVYTPARPDYANDSAREARTAVGDFRALAHSVAKLPTALFAKTQFPDRLERPDGETLEKPTDWYMGDADEE